MELNATSYYGLYRPGECERRPYLQAIGEEEAKPSPYEEVIRELGIKYEQRHLESIGKFTDIRSGSEDERIKATIDAISRGDEVLYQPAFRAVAKLNGNDKSIVGEPDFLIKDGESYRIRDVKISRRINEKDHPEILLQLGLYGWLFERTIGIKPTQLEVFSGTGAIEVVSLSAISEALSAIERIDRLKTAAEEPFSPVGWSKCGPCGFQQRCWNSAVEAKNVSTVPRVDKGLAIQLRSVGVNSISELLGKFDEASLAALARPWGTRTQKVGSVAAKILRAARAIQTGKEELLKSPDLPTGSNFVMFDLEGLPPQLDELDKIFLWGIQVFGERPGAYIGDIPELGDEGDRKGWFAFLGSAKGIFNAYGDIPFVHWAPYERTKLSTYIKRYGDPEGIADRVVKNLVDLLSVTQESIALPLPSYSLKVVEKHVGFKRSQDEYGGDWAMATFIRATELGDVSERQKLLDSIRTYNREDLEATWAVFRWLQTKKAE